MFCLSFDSLIVVANEGLTGAAVLLLSTLTADLKVWLLAFGTAFAADDVVFLVTFTVF